MRTAIALLIAWVLAVGGCSSGSRRGPVVAPPAGVSETALGHGDVFSVQVFGEKDLSGKFQVSGRGTINYPLVGTVRVAGLTPPQVAATLTNKLAAGYLKEPSVSVFVEAYNSKKVSIFGQVSKPGTFNYVDNMSIVEAITLAGGFTPIASKNDVTVTRVISGQSQRVKVPVEDIGQAKAQNYLLKPGDIIFVPERMF